HHNGWGGSFADPHYTGWGSVIESLVPDEEDEEDGDEDEEAGETSAEDFPSDLLSAMEVAGKKLGDDKDAMKILRGAREFFARVDAYDGSLDPAPLRKAG